MKDYSMNGDKHLTVAIISVHASPLASLGGKKAGGMNVYIRELSQQLGKLGVQVDIFTRCSTKACAPVDDSLGPNVRVIHLNAGPELPLAPDDIYPYLSEFTARLMAYATKHNRRYDVIYSHYWLSGWVAYKLKETWGTPFVHMFHTLGQMKQRILSHDVSSPDLRTTIETHIVEWSDRIVAATPAEQAQLRWLYRAKRKKIVIIPPGVNIERFHPQTYSEAKKRLGFSDSCHLLLFVGRIEPLKSVDTILQSLHFICQRDPSLINQVCFAIIGGELDAHDPEIARLRAMVDELGLGCVVSFLGAKDQAVLPMYYAAATAVIMPSDYESFGMVALEAMASGTPVIASDVGGLSYLVQEDETGFLVPTREPISLAQRIQTLLTDPQKREQMGQTASQSAQNYAWPTIAERIMSVFNELLSQNLNHRKRWEYSLSSG